MKLIRVVVALTAFLSGQVFAQESKTYVGVITDTMCTTDHKPMNVSPDEKCVRESATGRLTSTHWLTARTSTS